MTELVNALIPCVLLGIVVFGVLFLTYNARGRIESLKINKHGLEIKFCKDSKPR